MKTILEKSVHGNLRNFRTLRWRSSNNLPNSSTGTFWQVRTQYRMFNFIEFMKMRHFYIGLNLLELRCLIDAPGVLKDEKYLSLLKAKEFLVPLKVLEQRLNTLNSLNLEPTWSMNLLFTHLGNCNYEIVEFRQAIRPFKKFSGYVRNIASIGSNLSKNKPEPEIFEWVLSYELDYFKYFTVGEF